MALPPDSSACLRPNSEGSTRKSLVLGLRRRDPIAWQQMVSLYQPLLQAWCRKLHVSESDRDDVVQEVLKAVSRSVEEFQFRRMDGDLPAIASPDPRNGSEKSRHGESRSELAASPGSFRGWLWTIARHKVIDYHRAIRRRVTTTGGSDAVRQLQQFPDVEGGSSDGGEPTDPGDLRGLLQRALELVSAEFGSGTWRAFWRSTIDQVPTDVVAAELGVSVAAVRQARSRILRRLRRQLGDQT